MDTINLNEIFGDQSCDFPFTPEDVAVKIKYLLLDSPQEEYQELIISCGKAAEAQLHRMTHLHAEQIAQMVAASKISLGELPSPALTLAQAMDFLMIIEVTNRAYEQLKKEKAS